MLWLILFFIAVASCYYNWLYKPMQYWKEKGMIYLKPDPLLKQLMTAVIQTKPMTEYFQKMYDSAKEKGAKCIGIYRFCEPMLLVTDVELIKKITIKDFNHFVDHMSFIDEEVDPLFGKNMFALRGKNWREMRNTLTPAFTTSKMRSMYCFIDKCAQQLTTYFLNEAASNNNQTLTLEMKDVFTRYANDVIATATFGIECDSLKERDNEFYLMSKDACDFSGLKALRFLVYAISPFLAKIFKVKVFSEKVCSFFRNIVVDSVAYREKEGIIRPDMIHLLMQARKGQLKNDETSNETTDNPVVKSELSDDDITAQALLFFLAGFDTSSTLMCYVAYELAVNPDLQVRLQEEIDAAIEVGKGHVEYDVLMKMTYLDMVVSETLRKWPSAVISDRKCVKSYDLKPTGDDQPTATLESGISLWIPTFSIHRDPAYFPDPERFDPERFNAENKKNIDPYAYMPFGLGPRNCIGSRFALMESKSLFVQILSKFDIVVVDKTLVPIQLCPKTWNLNVKGGLWLGLRPRISTKSI